MFTTHKMSSSPRRTRSSKTVNLRSQQRRAIRRQVPEEYRTFNRKKGPNVVGIIFLLIMVLGASLVGYYYWSQEFPAFQGDSVSMNVTGPSRLVSGDEATYRVEYENNDQVTLTQVKLSAQWPDGFYFNEATQSPADTNATTWDLPDLAPGMKAEIGIIGQLVGAKDEEQQVIFRLSYEPLNFSSEFQVKSVATTLITDSKIDFSLNAPDKILSGQDIDLTVTFKNTTKETLFDVHAEIALPPDLENVTVEPELVDNAWVGDLQAGEEIKLLVHGRIATDARLDQDWLVEIGQVVDEQVRRLVRDSRVINLVNPSVAAVLTVNGRSKDFEAEWGDTLNYVAQVTNTSASDLEDVEVSVLMDSTVLDVASYSGDGRLKDLSITFDKTTSPALATLAAGQSVEVTWKIDIANEAQPGRITIDNVAKISLGGLESWQQTSPLLIISVGQGLSFRQSAYWDLGTTQVGSGALPPQRGKTTSYLVIWSIDNGTEDFTSVTASTFLPPNVTFLDEQAVEDGSLTYDGELRRLSWTIDNFGAVLLPTQITFTIRLEPTADDVGSVVPVLNETSIVATGGAEFSSKVTSIRSSQVIADKNEDIGTVIE